MRRLIHRPFTTLVGDMVTQIKYGNELTPSCGSYGAITLTMSSGRTFIVWTSMGEVTLSEIMVRD